MQAVGPRHVDRTHWVGNCLKGRAHAAGQQRRSIRCSTSLARPGMPPAPHLSSTLPLDRSPCTSPKECRYIRAAATSRIYSDGTDQAAAVPVSWRLWAHLAWQTAAVRSQAVIQQLAALRTACMPGQECSCVRHLAPPHREQDGAQVWALSVWVLEQAAVASVGQRA